MTPKLTTICSNYIESKECNECKDKGYDRNCKYLKLAKASYIEDKGDKYERN